MVRVRGMHGAAREDRRGDGEVAEPAVGAAADEHLVERRSGDIVDVVDVVDARVHRHLRSQALGVDDQRSRVVGTNRVQLERLVAGVREGDRVGFHDPGLGAEVGAQVAERQALVDAHRGHRLAAPFHRAVVGTVGAHLRDHVQREVLGVDASGQRAAHLDANRLGDAEPRLPGGEHDPDVGGTQAGREAAEATVGRAVRIGADDDAARPGEPPIDHHLVADALGEEVGDRVLDAELADDPMQLGGGNRVGGHDVVEVEDDAARVPERQIEASERLDGKRAGDVVGHGDVDLGDDGVAGVDGASQAPAEQFLGDAFPFRSPTPVPS